MSSTESKDTCEINDYREDTEYAWEIVSDHDFSDVGGLQDVKQTFQRLVVNPLVKQPTHYARFDVPIPNILLHGPPGTGKTYVSKALAGELQVPVTLLSGTTVTSKWINESTERIQTLFDEAASLADEYGYSMIFLDEVDAVLQKRTAGVQGHQEDTKVVNEFLTRLQTTGEDGILFVAATNRRESLDSAATRAGRIDREIEIGIPGARTRSGILIAHLRDRPTAIKEDELKWLVEETAGLSAAEIEMVVTDAARRAADRKADAITYPDLARSLPVD